MKILVAGGPLRQDRPHTNIRGINLHDKLPVWVLHLTNGGSCEFLFTLTLTRHGSCYQTVVPDEMSRKVGNPAAVVSESLVLATL